ncbi:ParB/RepB/Spo0J family partition protein [Aquamicrobium sp. LC103]|uniref:ParB/RepB/Spo0J family partition protein n=1 Tax=Aquamicrobium sp. LC103 TaxID=1120658 RepID=UPI0010C9C795|nr:ParB/RepB/Spo0J family partition protein [Aquamicrobium sp. LC103]TKT80012.1 hypothetical protein XW59_006530 [Aquamicrobium sp. LC103]
MISYDSIKSGEVAAPVSEAVRDLDIDLSEIKLDQSAQPRESLNNDRIAEYAEAMKAGDQFPPLTVFHDSDTYWLADGFHRHYAAQHAGRKHARCNVRQGGLRDAILWSVGANAKHGLARSDEDKKRAVMRLLDDAEWSTWADRDIAKRCLVSHPFVAKIRKAHAGLTGNVTSERTYTTKHGTVATMKTAGINASRTQFQAKASEDNGSITGGAGTVTGEASRLASGRTDAGEATSVDLPTDSADAIERAWKHGYLIGFGSSAEGWNGEYPFQGDDIALNSDPRWVECRDLAFDAHRHDLLKSSDGMASGSEHPSAIRNGPDMEQDDVDRSALRASSAVEVGATNSPDGATVSASSGRPEGSERLQVLREPTNAAEPDGCDPENSADDGWDVEAAGGAASVITNSPSSQAADRAPEVSPPASEASILKTLSKADQIRRLRPHCQHPGSDLCGGSGRSHCHVCKKAMEGEAA